jgi:ankyrin repeat protein
MQGNSMAVEYLVTTCNADMEQKNLYEVEEEKTFHYATSLWAAAVANHLHVVKLLVRLGANINSQVRLHYPGATQKRTRVRRTVFKAITFFSKQSDSGSTAVRSACFMTNIEVVQFLVDAGANFKLSNFNGGTCLINSVQSIDLCKFLIMKGADVNARFELCTLNAASRHH